MPALPFDFRAFLKKICDGLYGLKVDRGILIRVAKSFVWDAIRVILDRMPTGASKFRHLVSISKSVGYLSIEVLSSVYHLQIEFAILEKKGQRRTANHCLCR